VERVTDLTNDVRYGLRSLRKDRGFTAAAVLLLALGIGANTAIFSVVSALLLEPLPYRDADRLVLLWNRSPGLDIAQDWFSTAQYFDIKGANPLLEELAIAIGGNDNLTGVAAPNGAAEIAWPRGGTSGTAEIASAKSPAGHSAVRSGTAEIASAKSPATRLTGYAPAERVGVLRVSSNLLPMLGVTAHAGRLFGAAEDREGGPAVALLSYGTWARRYGADPGLLGRTITLNGKPHEVIGILPRSFSLPREVLPTLDGAEQAEIVLPLPLSASAATVRGHEDYNLLGKLKPGASLREAQARNDALTARLRADFPEVYPPNGGLTFSIVPLREQVVGDVRHPLALLQGAALFVLLIACVNVANLLLSRAVVRRKEIAVRTAIGASASRIVRQLLTESAVLGVAGGALGIGFAIAGVAALRTLGRKSVPRLSEVGVDGNALLFTLLVSLAAAALFGLAPALRASRVDLTGTLKEGERGTSGAALRNRLRRLLVIGELALSLVLLVGAGLLVRSFARLRDVNPGFDPRGVLTVELAASGARYKEPEVVRATYKRLFERLETLPGVSAAGGVSSLPLSEMFAWGPVTVEGRVPPPGEKFLNADQRTVGGRYFEAMKIPLVAGRLFGPDDTPDKTPVVLVDQPMARKLWPGQDPLGKRITLGDLAAKRAWVTVVGVVGGVKQDALDTESRIALYLPQSQRVGRTMSVVIRTSADPVALAPAVRRELDQIDRDIPMYRVLPMEARVAESLARRRFTTLLLGLFAGLALVLATIGVYGVMSYTVRQGTREIGIRMAIGATPRGILGLVVRQGMALAAGGIALGLAVALAGARLLSGLLFGVAPRDPLTFAAIASALAAAALVAVVLPARRASRVDPIEALRYE